MIVLLSLLLLFIINIFSSQISSDDRYHVQLMQLFLNACGLSLVVLLGLQTWCKIVSLSHSGVLCIALCSSVLVWHLDVWCWLMNLMVLSMFINFDCWKMFLIYCTVHHQCTFLVFPTLCRNNKCIEVVKTAW